MAGAAALAKVRMPLEVLVRPGDHLDADDLADPAGRRGAGVDGRLHRRDVARHEGRDQAAADLVPADEVDVRRLQHRVAGLDQGDEPLAFDHAERFNRCTWPSRPSFVRSVGSVDSWTIRGSRVDSIDVRP